MTNADLLKMLKGGVPESVMLSAIRSSNHNFDFSPESCRELQAAHISRQVLDAMGDGSVRPCPTIQGNARQRTVKNAIVNLRAPKALKKMTNPRLAAQNAEILAVLQQQHQVAQQEAAAMKITVRPASTTASLTRVPATAGLNEGVPVQGVGPETVQDGRGSLSSSMTHAPGLNTTALTCSYNTTPRILQVSGGQSHGVFTPEAKYNLYTIVGCGFGQSQSGNSAFIFAANGFRANLNIDYWSDNGITAHLDPYLAGVLDQSNVTLVVAPAGAQQLEKSGFSFYAARGMPGPDGGPQEVQLGFDSMPQAYVNSQNSDPVLAGFNQVPSNAQSQFPSFSFQGTPVAAWVFRYAYGHWDPYSGVNSNECFLNDAGASIAQCQAYFDPTSTFKGGADTWDFSKLVPGFAISSYDLYYEDVDPSQLCGSWEDMEKKSGVTQNWDFNQSAAAQITVTWPIYWCENRELPPSDRKSEQKQSAYGLAVWVLGPRCVDPWSGQKDQSCMDEIRKMFS